MCLYIYEHEMRTDVFVNKKKESYLCPCTWNDWRHFEKRRLDIHCQFVFNFLFFSPQMNNFQSAHTPYSKSEFEWLIKCNQIEIISGRRWIITKTSNVLINFVWFFILFFKILKLICDIVCIVKSENSRKYQTLFLVMCSSSFWLQNFYFWLWF